MKNIRSRKGQMEIMGLIVIVILLTIGMFFIISFKTQTSQPQVKKTYEQDQLASNFLIAFLKTDSGCSNLDLKKLVQDCAADQNINCKGKDSCEFVNNTMNIILKNTFDEWGKNYSLTTNGMGTKDINFDYCHENANRESAFQPISLYPYPGTVTMKLDLCNS
ncbi:hypothetical protein ACFLTH_12550 [Bacteroidota bacterium]